MSLAQAIVEGDRQPDEILEGEPGASGHEFILNLRVYDTLVENLEAVLKILGIQLRLFGTPRRILPPSGSPGMVNNFLKSGLEIPRRLHEGAVV